MMLHSEIYRSSLSICSMSSLSSGDLVFFSSRSSSSLKRELNLCIVRMFTRSEFDHVGLLIKKNEVLYVMDRRKNGYVSLLPLRQRLLRFNGYVAIRNRKKAIKDESKLWKMCVKMSKENKGRRFNNMRFLHFVFNPDKTFIPWMSCNDLIHEVMHTCNETMPVLFPRNIMKKCEEYDEAKLLKYF